MRRLLVVMLCGAGVALLAPAASGADGGPVPAFTNGAGASAPGGRVGYVAVAAGRNTVIERVRRTDGFVLDSRLLRGQLGVPGVAFDGSTTGLSANGRTLVLTGLSNRYPVRRTELVFLDARRLQVRGRVTLPGWFTADAISPDGRSLYLIHYPSNGNILRYEVRAYDIPSQRLVRKPVIDPREPDEAMRGMPMARVVSADGRWAYTLYDRPQGRPFIHALDTTGRTARCLDLPYSATGSQSPVRLALVDGGRELRVRNDDGPLASVNLSTFKVSDLLSQRVVKTLAPRPAPATARHASSGVRWIIALVVVALGAAAALALAAGRRRRRPPHDVGISVEVR